MANKTAPTKQSAAAIIDAIEEPEKRNDAIQLLQLMKKATGEEPVIWGGSMIGFGNYHYKYDSGREGDWFITGFSPRKREFSVYIMSGFNSYPELMEKLGKYKTGKSCLYIKRMSDIDSTTLTKLVEESVKYIRKKYPSP